MKHLADHRSPAGSTRLVQFLRIARSRGESAWTRVWQRPFARLSGNRRVVEFARIERARTE